MLRLLVLAVLGAILWLLPVGHGAAASPKSETVTVVTGAKTYKKLFKKSFFLKKNSKSVRPTRNQARNIKAVRASASNLSNLRPSRAYRTNGNIDAQVCQSDGIFNSYDAFLDCTDLAISQCTGDESEKAFCIYERCGNTPDNFESLWRDLDADSKFVGSQFYKSDFGSSASGQERFSVSLNPCLIDGAGKFETNSYASALVMGKSFSLGTAYLRLFHPAKAENSNLSSGIARLSFDQNILMTIQRDDFGNTTVPFSFKQELFKSFTKTSEDPSRVYWVDGVIPVHMIFRPQGVIGMEVEARVSPESRVLEVNFASYNDFGTSADAGPAREGVTKNSSMGVLSLMQSEYRTSKFIAMNAEATSMLPSISELSQVEYWPPKGSFMPICAQWFKSATTHPQYGYRCSTLVDFGPLSERKGAVFTGRDGSDRLVYYLDRSQGGNDGTLVPFPYRSPILDDF